LKTGGLHWKTNDQTVPSEGGDGRQVVVWLPPTATPIEGESQHHARKKLTARAADAVVAFDSKRKAYYDTHFTDSC
jgi:hypothetical protein